MGKIILLVSAICLVTSGLFAQKIQDGFENLSTIIAPDMLYFSDIEDDHRTSWNTEAGTVFGVKHKVRPYFGTSCELRLGKSQKLTMLGALRMFSNFSSDLSVGLHAQLGKVNLGGGLFSRSLSTNDSKPSRVGLALNLGYRSEKIGDKHFIDIQTQTNLGLKHEGLVFLQ
ncbi:MAG TPA: hypothetical protein PKC14_03765, partial [Candidatus Absconditabacterales bacterium]|nr:hypothetical protein [Candidatus Absconditabacterales bacterium]